MKYKDAIKTLLKTNNKNQTWLAEAMKYKRPNAVSEMLNSHKTITLDTLYRICEQLDYEITIQPKRRKGLRPVGQILIEGSGEEK